MPIQLVCKVISATAMAAAISSCAGVNPARMATTAVGTSAGGAAGAGLGAVLSGGNPLVTAGSGAIGAASGFVASEAINYTIQRGEDKARQEGFQDGERQATKQFYRALQDMQMTDASEAHGSLVEYEVEVPGGVNPDGVRVVPYTVMIPLVE